jgi:hypothetical protein
MKPLAIVDVDSTLFDFSQPWHEAIRKTYHDFPTPETWSEWDLTKIYPKAKKIVLYNHAHTVHMNQRRHFPFTGAIALLSWMSKHYSVTIATHRRYEAKTPLLEWLDDWYMPYFDLYVGDDKTTLFGDAALVIDDCPSTLIKAQEMGIDAYGIEWPWNRGRGFSLFKSLPEMHRALLAKFNAMEGINL